MSKKMMTTYSPMIDREQFFDTMIVASSGKEWLAITTYPNISARNCIEPPLAKTKQTN